MISYYRLCKMRFTKQAPFWMGLCIINTASAKIMPFSVQRTSYSTAVLKRTTSEYRHLPHWSIHSPNVNQAQLIKRNNTFQVKITDYIVNLRYLFVPLGSTLHFKIIQRTIIKYNRSRTDNTKTSQSKGKAQQHCLTFNSFNQYSKWSSFIFFMAQFTVIRQVL